LLILVNSAQENLLELVLEGKVECLGGKVSNDVGQIASPEGERALLLGDADECINDT
jgi:hypothetical protein